MTDEVEAVYTDNFNPTDDPKLLCTCGHEDCDERSVSQRVLNAVQEIRVDLGQPMVITSGGRCPNHPDEVAKAQAGDHQKCTAVDVRYSSTQERTKLLVLAGRHGATRVAFGNTFVHMAWTPTSRTDVPTWEY